MDILLAFLAGTAFGLIAHYALPGRDLRGVALAPVLGALVGGAVWMALTWAGLTTLDVWLWVASFAAPVVVVFPAVAILTRMRRAHDQRERVRLRIA